MFILVFLLSIFSVTRVWLKPTLTNTNSDLSVTNNDDEVMRFKRQTAFFDLLQQAIEKYANCADTHLATLKALAKYKQYETFPYPKAFSQPSHPIVPAVNANQHEQNLGNCAKFNLCRIQDEHFPSAVRYNVNPKPSRIDKLTPYFPSNIKEKPKLPISGNNHFRFGNIPAKLNTNYSESNNLTKFAILNGPALLYNTGAKIFPSGGLINATSYVQINKWCPCLEIKTPHGNDDNKEEGNKNKVVQTESLHSSKLDAPIADEKANGCSCPQNIHEEQAGSNITEPKKPLPTTSPADKLPSSDSSNREQNLNILFQQLDEMIHKVNNTDLKAMLENLKTFKSAFSINSTQQECGNDRNHHPATTSTTVSPETKCPSILSIIKQKLFGSWRQPDKNKTKKPSKDMKKDNSTDVNLSKNNKVLNSTQFNQTNANSSSLSNFEPTKSINKVPETVSNTSGIITTSSSLNDSDILQNLADIKSAFLNLNESTIKHSVETKTNSTISITNLAKIDDLLRLREQILSSTLPKVDKNTSANLQANYTALDGVKQLQQVISQNNQTDAGNNSNQTNLYNKDQLENLNLLASTLNKSLSLIAPISDQNDTKITLSITSTGKFKNIQVEQQLVTDKNVEINERENMNMAAPRSKVKPVDMMGTGSRHINILKQPEKSTGSYAEPILSEIHSGTSRFRTKPPLSIYWHRIEKEPLKLKRISSEVLKAYQSAGIDDIGNTRHRNEDYVSNMLRKGIDCEKYSCTEESESWLLT